MIVSIAGAAGAWHAVRLGAVLHPALVARSVRRELAGASGASAAASAPRAWSHTSQSPIEFPRKDQASLSQRLGSSLDALHGTGGPVAFDSFREANLMFQHQHYHQHQRQHRAVFGPIASPMRGAATAATADAATAADAAAVERHALHDAQTSAQGATEGAAEAAAQQELAGAAATAHSATLVGRLQGAVPASAPADASRLAEEEALVAAFSRMLEESTKNKAGQTGGASLASFPWNKNEQSALFHVLDAPKGFKFPFDGKGAGDEVSRLLLRRSHDALYSTLLAHLRLYELRGKLTVAERRRFNALPRRFVVRGPPGTGKSVMLNLLWLAGVYELRVPVLCQRGAEDFALYETDGSVWELTREEARRIAKREGVLYLFDPDEVGAGPLYDDQDKSFLAVASSPDDRHYRVVSTKDIRKKHMWSFAWSRAEVLEGLRLLGLPAPDADVRAVMDAALGEFRMPLSVARSGDAKAVLRLLRDSLAVAVKSLGFSASPVTSICEVEYSHHPDLSEWFITQVSVSGPAGLAGEDRREGAGDSAPPVSPAAAGKPAWASAPQTKADLVAALQVKLAAAEAGGVRPDGTVLLGLTGVTAEAADEHEWPRLVWKSEDARDAVRNALAANEELLMRIVALLPPGAAGSLFELGVLHVARNKPLELHTQRPKNWPRDPPLDMCGLKYGGDGVTVFEGAAPPYGLIAAKVREGLAAADGIPLAPHRFDPSSREHPDFDSYHLDWPLWPKRDPRVSMIQSARGSHKIRFGAVFAIRRELLRVVQAALSKDGAGCKNGVFGDVIYVFIAPQPTVKIAAESERDPVDSAGNSIPVKGDKDLTKLGKMMPIFVGVVPLKPAPKR